MPVSKLAKWKTTFQLVALGALILGGAVHGQPCQSVGEACGTLAQSWVHLVGLVSLVWIALWGFYFRDNPRDHPRITAEELSELPPM